MHKTIQWAATLTLAGLASLAGPVLAQMPPALAERLLAIGPVIDAGATAPLYAPQFVEREPYKGVDVERDVAYGPSERNLLDVFTPAARPAGKPLPVLVFVHGGAFVAGNRRTGVGSPFYDNVMLWATDHGMVGVNMTYRLAPKDPWPAGPQDIGQALRWMQAHIGARGGDPGRVFLLGHSAGAAHVAAYVARPEFHAPGPALAGAMLLSGVYRVTPELVAQSPTYPSYFGSDAARYAERSSLDGLVAGSTPLWVGQAALDPPQFKAQAELLRERLQAAGRPFASATFAGHSHMSQAYSIRGDDHSVGDALWAFIEQHR
ncbi:MAG: alpha/beta hydrolase [Vitreoscilla sp.]